MRSNVLLALGVGACLCGCATISNPTIQASQPLVINYLYLASTGTSPMFINPAVGVVTTAVIALVLPSDKESTEGIKKSHRKPKKQNN